MATTEIYTLSLHDALPIFDDPGLDLGAALPDDLFDPPGVDAPVDDEDRKSTRLNSSHLVISYAVFCLKKEIERIYVREVRALPHPFDQELLALDIDLTGLP